MSCIVCRMDCVECRVFCIGCRMSCIGRRMNCFQCSFNGHGSGVFIRSQPVALLSTCTRLASPLHPKAPAQRYPSRDRRLDTSSADQQQWLRRWSWIAQSTGDIACFLCYAARAPDRPAQALRVAQKRTLDRSLTNPFLAWKVTIKFSNW